MAFFSRFPRGNISTKAFPERTHQAGRFELKRGAFIVFSLEMRFVKKHIKQDLLLCDDDNDNDDNDDNGAAPIIEPSSHLRDGGRRGGGANRASRAMR